MMTNLDVKCAEAGMKLIQVGGSDERLLNNALGVLQEQGLYACFLYLKAQGNAHASSMSDKLYEFLCGIPALNLEKKRDDRLNEVAKLSDNLDNLLFARELLLQVLTYARYHLKAKWGEGA